MLFAIFAFEICDLDGDCQDTIANIPTILIFLFLLGEMQRISFRLMLSSCMCVSVCLSVCLCVCTAFVDLKKTV